MNTLLVWIWKNSTTIKNWLLWVVLTCFIAGFAGAALLSKSNSGKEIFLPDTSSNGHYQIEQQCDICHEAFSDKHNGNQQKACLRCHQGELQRANDSHSLGKFRDPRNYEYLENIDALKCVTCHREHKPEITRQTGVTIARDFCIHCHEDIGTERKTHKDLDFNGCDQCHNYHDNRALYEDFLVKHRNEPSQLASMKVTERNYGKLFREKHPNRKPLDRNHIKVPHNIDDSLLAEWESTAHAKSGIDCRDCHQPDTQPQWINKPSFEMCKSCHKKEQNSFTKGRHGMRLDQKNLSPMQPGMARLPMKKAVHDKQLTCNSCHPAHRFDTNKAGVESCLKCHDDRHSRNYKHSSHYRLITAKGKQGVSCANCHMPRLTYRMAGKTQVYVQHNQNDNLRPRHKMIRDVCMNCHGLRFTLDALADDKLIANNFSSQPQTHLKSIDMATSKIKNAHAVKQESRK